MFQSLDLLGIKDGVGAKDGVAFFFFLTGLGVFNVRGDRFVKDDLAAPLSRRDMRGTFLDRAAKFLPLLEGSPASELETIVNRVQFKKQGVDAGVGVVAGYVAVPTRVLRKAPGTTPGNEVSFQGVDDFLGDLLADLSLVWQFSDDV